MALVSMRQLLDHAAEHGYGVPDIGAVGAAILGIIPFCESRDPARIACVAMIVVGIIGLKITSAD